MFNPDHAIEPSRAFLICIKVRCVSNSYGFTAPSKAIPTHFLCRTCLLISTDVVVRHPSYVRTQFRPLRSVTQPHWRSSLVAPTKFPWRETVESLLPAPPAWWIGIEQADSHVGPTLFFVVPMKIMGRYPPLDASGAPPYGELRPSQAAILARDASMHVTANARCAEPPT